jgi:hypothetical protein
MKNLTLLLAFTAIFTASFAQDKKEEKKEPEKTYAVVGTGKEWMGFNNIMNSALEYLKRQRYDSVSQYVKGLEAAQGFYLTQVQKQLAQEKDKK